MKVGVMRLNSCAPHVASRVYSHYCATTRVCAGSPGDILVLNRYKVADSPPSPPPHHMPCATLYLPRRERGAHSDMARASEQNSPPTGDGFLYTGEIATEALAEALQVALAAASDDGAGVAHLNFVHVELGSNVFLGRKGGGSGVRLSWCSAAVRTNRPSWPGRGRPSHSE